jgi:predicted nucleic-acid-binding protein
VPGVTIAMALDPILATEQLEIDQKDVVRAALEDYRAGGGDFAAYVVGRRGREAGCETTATFDRRLKASGLFRLLSS